jgi:hypothetical protein
MDTSLGRPGAIVKQIDPKVFIFGGAIVVIAGFFMIHPYMPDVGPLENAMIGSIPIGNAQLPYRYVLVFATIRHRLRLLQAPELQRRETPIAGTVGCRCGL